MMPIPFNQMLGDAGALQFVLLPPSQEVRVWTLVRVIVSFWGGGEQDT